MTASLESIETESADLNYKNLFNSLPDLYLLIRADAPTFTLLDANDAHVAHTGLKRTDFVGKPFFEVWPDVSEKYLSTGFSAVKESLLKVIRTGQPDETGVLRYDIKNENGEYQTRFWQPVHYPIFDQGKNLLYILQANRDITEDVNIKNKLEETQDQLTRALSAGLVGTWVYYLDNDKVMADKNLARMFGVDPEKAAHGLNVSVFINSIHPEDRERVEQAIEATLTQGAEYDIEYRTIGENGDIRWVIARGTVAYDNDGKATVFSGVIIDVTDRKLAEQAVTESESRLKFMAESMPQKVFTADPSGEIDYFNPQWMEFTGLTFDAIKGWDWLQFIHPDDLAETKRYWQLSIEAGESFEIEHRFRKYDGSYHWHLTRARAMHDERGKVIKWIGSNTDITEKKETEENLKILAEVSKVVSSSMDYMKSLRTVAKLVVPAMTDWVVVDLLGEDDRLHSVAIVHKDKNKVQWAKNLREKYPTDMNASQGVAKVMTTGKSEYVPRVSQDLLRSVAHNDEHFRMLSEVGLSSMIIAPLKIQDRTIGTMTFIRAEKKNAFTHDDCKIVEELVHRVSLAMTNVNLYKSAQQELVYRERLEEELRQANELLESRVQERTLQLQETNQSLERSNQELQDFAYVASHDLQEPLRKIQAFGNLLLEEYGDKLDEGKDYLERMSGAASRMSVLITDLLAFSRVTTKARSFTEVDLEVIAQEVVSDLETRIKDTKGDVTVKKLPVIMADPLQMRQLLQNLIGNALKFHRPNTPPKVSVASTVEKGKNGKIECHVLTVSDNGIGFNEKYLDRIFAVFQRLHEREAYEGTGIGLAVCRKIVERHGGSITAESTVNRGSKFIIKLPAGRKEEA